MRIKSGQAITNMALILLTVFVALPFLLVASTSISNETDIIYNGYRLIPISRGGTSGSSPCFI